MPPKRTAAKPAPVRGQPRTTAVPSHGKQNPASKTTSQAAKRTTTGGPTAKRIPVGGGAAGSKKPGAATGKGGGPAKNVDKKAAKTSAPKKPVLTEKDKMACKIQTAYRAYRCRKQLLDLKRKQAEYDQLMDKLQKEAFVQLVKLEQQRAEQEQKQLDEARKKQKEQAKRVKAMLEAAFDGYIDVIKKLVDDVKKLYCESGDTVVEIQQHKLVECSDANDNTPLSEAAAGGDPNTIRTLIALGANLNIKGQYGRTPLYRAAFAGHLEAVKVLLEAGADPRICADDGAQPQQIASQPSVEEVFTSWDIAETDQLLVKLDAAKNQRIERERKQTLAEENKIQNELEEAEKQYSSSQKKLMKAHEELNKRIYEHDKYGVTKSDLTLLAVHDAEDFLEITKLEAEKGRQRLEQVRMKLRNKRKEYQDAVGDDDSEKVDVEISLKELDDVLLKDVGQQIAKSERWPLIIDPTKMAATFLRYRDTNYLNVCNPRHMEQEVIRLALIGAIRYGKFLVVDLLDLEDMWPVVEQKLESIQKNLLSDLMSMALIKEEKYLSLIKPTDGEEYSAKMFLGAKVHNFKFVILTQLYTIPKYLVDQCYIIRINVSSPQ